VAALPPDFDARVLGFLRGDLGIDDALVAEDALITTGRVDSVGLLRLVAFVEKASGLTIPNRDVKTEHFDSVRKIRSYLERRANP
jgi:acyl carrier protein